jgi:3',5'-cyclic AMP phosphodiesterase CpdA
VVTPHPDPDPLPPLSSVVLTTTEAISPTHAIVSPTLSPKIVGDMEVMITEGYGDFERVAGWPIEHKTFDGGPAPAPGPNAQVITRFVHLADTQLADDESPARLASVDLAGSISGAFRPQEGHECRILNAAVRTINALHQAEAIDFVILGGDNIDNAQQNELDWFQSILDGSPRVECDSGADDDPLQGAANDPKDPFFAGGLEIPWLWVTGNHDVLAQGNFPVAEKTAEAVGSVSPLGTRDWSQPGAPVVKGAVIADENRKMMERADLLARVSGAGDGHGIVAEALALGKAYYTFDIDETALRIVVMDSAAETGGAEGVIHQADIDAFLKPALDAAATDGKIVIVTSHHASSTLGDGGTVGGTVQPDAVSVEDFQAFLGGYDNVLMHLAGHTHVHRVTKVEPPGGHPYWELETSALADFPHQVRLIEIVDHDNGFVSIRAIGVDYSTENDDISADGRVRGIIDLTSGWLDDGSGDPTDRNVELWFPLP